MVTRKLMTTLNNNREEYFCFHPLLCLLLQIQMNPDSLLTPDFYTLLYVSTAVDNLFLTGQPDSIYKSDAFYRHVDEKAGASGKRFHMCGRRVGQEVCVGTRRPLEPLVYGSEISRMYG